jgi:hypothetical protein
MPDVSPEYIITRDVSNDEHGPFVRGGASDIRNAMELAVSEQAARPIWDEIAIDGRRRQRAASQRWRQSVCSMCDVPPQEGQHSRPSTCEYNLSTARTQSKGNQCSCWLT